VKEIHSGLTYDQARGLEQHEIDKRGGKKKLKNERNGVGMNNPR
jgi:hypothetical protein